MQIIDGKQVASQVLAEEVERDIARLREQGERPVWLFW